MCCASASSSSAFFRCWPSTATTPITTMSAAAACTSTARTRAFHRRKLSADAAPRYEVHRAGSPRAGYGLLLHRSTAAATTPPLLPACVTRPARIPTPPLQLPWLSERPTHGGANIKVMQMMHEHPRNLADPEDDEELRTYPHAGRRSVRPRGLIYGMGHAVYSV